MNNEIIIEQGGIGEIAGQAVNNALNNINNNNVLNISESAENFANMAGSLILSTPDLIVDFIIQLLMSVTNATNALLTGVNVAQNIITILKNALNIAISASTYAANIELLALLLYSACDVDIVCNPSVKDSTSKLGQSLKNILVAQYNSAKLQLIDLYNSMICTSNDAVIDNAMVSINNILDIVEPLLDPLIFKYTGHTISEIRALCHLGFLLICMLKRVNLENKLLQLQDKAKEQLNNIKDKTKEYLNNTKDNIQNLLNTAKDNISDNFKLYAQDSKDFIDKNVLQVNDKINKAKEKAKELWLKKLQDFSKEEIKTKLLEWLNSQSIILQNAFEILIIKDAIYDIKIACQQMQNMSLENMADLVNVILSILNFFELIGLNENAKGLTINDLKTLGVTIVGSLASSTVNTVSNLIQNIKNLTEQSINNISNEINNSVQNTVNDTTKLINNTVDSTNTLANSTINTANNITNNTINNVNNIANNTINNTKNLVNQTTNYINTNTNTENLQTKSFLSRIEQNEQNTTIYITLLQYPYKDDQILKFLSNTFIYNNKQIFNNGAKKTIINKLIDIWYSGKNGSFKISGKADNVIRKYLFIVDILNDNFENLNIENYTLQITSNIQNSINVSGIANVANDFTKSNLNNLSNTANDFTKSNLNNLSNTANDFTKNIEQTTLNIVNNTLNIIDNAYNQLTSLTNIGLDTALIEQILNDKIMMFDEVVLIFKVFLPIVTALKFVLHLLENYKINKTFVRTKLHTNLLNNLRNNAQNILGLNNTLNLNNTNFYTIRTYNTYKWCLNNLNISINNANMCTINANETDKLLQYIEDLNLPKMNSSKAIGETTLYFDMKSIEQNDKNDGTLNNIDNLIYNVDANELYYDENNKSPYTSEINRAILNNIDPNYTDVTYIENNFDNLSNDEKIKKILKAITVKSDEFEGTLSIDLKNMNLCEPAEILNTEIDNEELKRIIIEFGDEYTNGTAVQYTLYVKPGDQIHNNQIIAKIIDSNNEEKFIKSPFNTGIVKSINNDTDYFHVYPSACKRHIIINGVMPGLPIIDTNDLSVYAEKMTKNSLLYTLITNHMLKSTYPLLLVNGYRGQTPFDFISNNCEAFTKFIEYYNGDNGIVKFSKKIENLSKNSIFNSEEIADGKFPDKEISLKDLKATTNKAKDDILYVRNVEIYNFIIGMYNAIANDNFSILHFEKFNLSTNGDYLYEDCLGLATNVKLLINNTFKYDDIKITKVANDSNYSNYYISILASIDMNTECEFTKKYYNLISDIISNRVNNEIDLQSLIDEFNTLYQKITNKSNGYTILYNEFINAFSNTKLTAYNNYKDDYDKVYTYIKHQIILYKTNGYNAIKNLNEEELTNWYNTLEANLSGNISADEFLGACGQLANIFMLIKSLNPNNDPISYRLPISEYEMYTNAFNTLFESEITNDISLKLYNNVFNTYADLCIYVFNLFKNITDSNISILPENLLKIANIVLSKIQKPISTFGSIQTTIILKQEDLFKEWIKSLTNIDIDNDILYKMYEIIYYLSNKTKLNDNDEIYYYATRIKNKFAYELVCDEANKIKNFWKEIIKLYENDYNLSKIMNELTTFANSFNEDMIWPTPIEIDVNGKKYDLYTFENKFPKDKNIDNICINPSKLSQTAIGEPTIDYNDIRDINPCDTTGITILDYEYWLVYMINATIITLLPNYWADGFDIPPYMSPVLLPAIYLPLAKPIYIPIVNVIIVVGLAIRGIWPMPIFLIVNLNSHDINAALPIMTGIEIVKYTYQAGMKVLEGGIPAIIDTLLNLYASQNAELKKVLDRYRNFSSIIKSIPLNNKSLIKKEFEIIAHVADNLDLRQVVTRLDKLDNGPEPM